MGLRSIQCTECRKILGFMDDFFVDWQSTIAVFICLSCKPTHKLLTVKDINLDTTTNNTGNE
jgi:hypothetical protein